MPLPLYGTLLSIIIASSVRYLSYGMRYAYAGALQIQPDLEGQAAVSGASGASVFRRIVLPLLAPTLINAWLLVFLLSVQAVSLPLLLVGPGSEVMAVTLFELWQNGQVTELASMGVLWMLLMTAVSAIFHLHDAPPPDECLKKRALGSSDDGKEQGRNPHLQQEQVQARSVRDELQGRAEPDQGARELGRLLGQQRQGGEGSPTRRGSSSCCRSAAGTDTRERATPRARRSKQLRGRAGCSPRRRTSRRSARSTSPSSIRSLPPSRW